MTRRLAGIFLALALAAAPLAAAAQSRSDEPPPSTGYSGMVGIGAALGTLIYAPLKLTYAITGSVLSGLAWVWTAGDTDVAGTILKSAIGGDYVVLPSHVEGERSLEFLGPQY